MEGKKHKILLCEDDPNLGSVLKNYLELNDYDVTLERDGRLGLAAFQREKFELCLLDVMMPNMDGFTLAEEIRDAEQEEQEAERKAEKKTPAKKEKGFFDDPTVKSMTRTAGNSIVRTLLGVLGLGGRSRSRKNLF